MSSLFEEMWDEIAEKNIKISDLEAKLAESKKKASKNYQEGYDLYLSLKQFYSRLGVEAYPDDEIQDAAVKELNRLLKENEELKAKLAESENQIYELQTKLNMKEYAPAFCSLAGRDCEALGKVDQLKQQLAEKDAEVQSWKDGTMVVKLGKLEEQLAEKEKEIKQLKLDLGMFKSTNEFINRYGIEKAREVLLQSEKTRNQTAIAVLEEMLDNEVYINSKLDFEDGNYVLSKIIRTKIEELRNGRN